MIVDIKAAILADHSNYSAWYQYIHYTVVKHLYIYYVVETVIRT